MNELRYKATAEALAGIDEGRRTVDHWITREVIDRDGEVVSVKGMGLDAYRSNPVVLFGHNQGLPAIGRNVDLTPQHGVGVAATTEFAPTPLASELFTLYAGGYMKGWSIGFRVLSAPSQIEVDGAKAMGLDSTELFEYSAVAVPANPEALSKAVEDGSSLAGLILKGYYQEAKDANEAARIADNVARFTGSLEGLVNIHRAYVKRGDEFPADLRALAEKAHPLLGELLEYQPEPHPADDIADLAPPEPHPAEGDLSRVVAELTDTVRTIREERTRLATALTKRVDDAVALAVTRMRRAAIGGG